MDLEILNCPDDTSYTTRFDTMSGIDLRSYVVPNEALR
jgi:hypothetical protein